VERILDSNIPIDFDIGLLITDNYKWVSETTHKLTQLKKFVITFISEANTQIIIFDVLGLRENQHTERQQFMQNLLNRIDFMFNQKIAYALRKTTISSKREFGDFIADNQMAVTQRQIQNQFSGNLVTITKNGGK